MEETGNGVKPKRTRRRVTKPNNNPVAFCYVNEISEKEYCQLEGVPYPYRQAIFPPQQLLKMAKQTGEVEVKPFDSTGGFSKRNGKEELEHQQLKADYEDLKKRFNEMTTIYHKEHPQPKPWYLSPLSWIGIICGVALIYMVYWFYQSSGGLWGLPPELLDWLINIGIIK